jgi:hypothetical protein
MALLATGCAPFESNVSNTVSSSNPLVQAPLPQANTNIRVTAPQAKQIVSSPLSITGSAKGNWYFEGSFPVKLYDANNKLIAQTAAKAQGNWMTENFVNFTATLKFAHPLTNSGKLILEKDNPSGDSQKDEKIEIPVSF